MVLFGESANMASKAKAFDLFPRGFLSKRSAQSKPYVSEEGMKSDDAFSSVRSDDTSSQKTKRKKLIKVQNKHSAAGNVDAQVTNTPRKRFSLSKYLKGEENLLQRLKRNHSDTALVKSRSGSVLDLSKNKSEPALSSSQGEKTSWQAPSFRLNPPTERTIPKFREADYEELMTGFNLKTDSGTTTLADTPALPNRSVEGAVTSRRLGQLKGMLDSHHRDYMSGEQIGNIQQRIKEMETALGTPLETRIHRLQKYRDNPKFKLSQSEQNRIQARIEELESQSAQNKTQALLDAVSVRLNADIKKGVIDPQSAESSQSTAVNSPGYRASGKLTPETPSASKRPLNAKPKQAPELETMSLAQAKSMTWSDLTRALVAYDQKTGPGTGKQLLTQKIPGSKTTFGHVFKQKQQEAYVEAKARRLLEQDGVQDSPVPTLKIREYSNGKDMLQQWQTEAEHLYPLQSKPNRLSW